MPHPMWRHPCCSPGARFSGSPACSDCGEPGIFDGWHLTMYERMALYQYVYGVKPLGPHRGLTDQLLGPMRLMCSNCAGHGICTLSADVWRACSACEGTGGVWTETAARVEAVYREVLRTFPDAAAGGRPRDSLGGTVVLDLANNEILTPGCSRRGGEVSQERVVTVPLPQGVGSERSSSGRWGRLLERLLARGGGSVG